MKTKPKSTHGGARQGAGRPPINGEPMTKREVWMMECQWEFCPSRAINPVPTRGSPKSPTIPTLSANCKWIKEDKE